MNTQEMYDMEPKTFNDYFLHYLVSNGLSGPQASDIMKTVRNEDSAMQGRWSDTYKGYPPQMLAVLSMSVRRVALAHIDKYFPNAWFRPVFAG